MENLIPVCILIDVEPDETIPAQIPDSNPILGFPECHRIFAEFRQQARKTTGREVHFSWTPRTDPVITLAYGTPTYIFDRFARQFHENLLQGDSLGTHIHAFRWVEDEMWGFEDWADAGYVDYCIEHAVEGYEQAMGERPALYRFGNSFQSHRAVQKIESLGAKIDVSIEPNRALYWRVSPPLYCTGDPPRMYDVPKEPYWPSIEDFRKPGPRFSRKIRLMPITTAYEDLGTDNEARLAHKRECGTDSRQRLESLYTWREWSEPNSYSTMITRAILAQKKPYIAITVRSEAPIFPERRNALLACLNALLKHTKVNQFSFCTPEECLAHLDAR
jgi:hypothetical protein